ncbi:MAG TPA: cytochrome c biogenesis protein ResB [Candidatus Acidoferrales bacterium]|nr:cytochrome c biogenesis protein ResB [Candidatus Acidoferrales bacterium]
MTARRLELRPRLARFWREYTRMRTAIFFLIGVVAIVAVGSFVPQQETSDPAKVQLFISDHPNISGLFAHLGLSLTDVFVSPVFYVLLGSLYIALLACVLRRGKALVTRTFRHYPRTPQYWGEWGSWLFHTSFFLLLVAVVWGKSTGYQGLVAVPEGKSFTETRAGYDQLQEGMLFGGQHTGFTMHLNSFQATYGDNGAASDYVSNVTVLDQGHPVLTKAIRVNDFLSYDGINVYQQDYGWAPTIVVRNPSGAVVFNGPVEFFGNDKSSQTGVLKVPDFGYTVPGFTQRLQLGARLAILPDARPIPVVNADGSIDPAQTGFAPGGLTARNPVIDMQLFVGDLGLNSGQPQDVNALTTSAMQPYFADGHVVPLSLGQTLPLDLPGAGGQSVQFSITFQAMHQYSLFQVSKDSGVLLVYATFASVMAGLLMKLYARPLLERRARRRRRTPLQLDARWTASVSGEPQPQPSDEAEEREPAGV